MGRQEQFDSKEQWEWKPRELAVLTLVHQQRALSLDHVPHFLALLEGKAETEYAVHLKSATHNLVERLQHAGLIHLQQKGKSTPGWIWLTKRGMQFLGFASSSWKRPGRHILPTLYAANTIRLHLTEHDPQIRWLSQQQLRESHADREPHLLPTAVIETEQGERIAIHVVLRLTGTEEQIAARMQHQLEPETPWEEAGYSALWYYATAEAARQLRAARAKIAERTSPETAQNIWIFSYPLVHKQVLYRGHHASVEALAWSADGTRLASASQDEVLHIWHALTGEERFCLALSACPSVLAWSSQGTWIALGDTDGRLSFWAGETGKLHMATIDSTGPITGLAWSPLNEQVVASCSVQGRLRVFDLGQNALQWEAQYAPGIETLAWSPDGTRLALGGTDGFVRLITATTGKHLQTYKKHNAAVQALVWSPDSQCLASASHDPLVVIWDATSGKKRRTICSGLSTIDVLSWSPDGTRLACAGSEPYVQVWESTTGRLLQTYADHAGEITGLAWSPEGTLLASASSDSTVHVYPVLGAS